MSRSADKARVLVVDDAAATLEVVERHLQSAGYRVMTAAGVDEALAVLEAQPIDLVVTDMKMPGTSGLELVRHVRENLDDTEVMMITGYATVEGAVEAVKTGAEEYLAKPFTDDELLAAVKRALGKLQERRANRPDVADAEGPHGIVGRSPAMRTVYRSLERASRTGATVLITGESGTGKELVARGIHYGGERSAAPFVAVNCGAIPENLLESELFGHVKGAFTGAHASRAGFFQTADGGTIFLDEISEMTLPMQVRLLRVLQEKEVYMVGSTRSRKVDVRILAATNKDLRALVQKGQFREDLFFRLNVLTIEVPPLRDRGEDVSLLIRYFTERFAEEQGRAAPRFSARALDALRHYHWPGNVRELENVVHRLVVMCDGETVEAPDLPSLMRFSALRGGGSLRPLAEVEAEHIHNVLVATGRNKTRAAEILGIDRKTLREKLKRMAGSGAA